MNSSTTGAFDAAKISCGSFMRVCRSHAKPRTGSRNNWGTDPLSSPNCGLNAASQSKDQHDQQNQADPAARIITPARTVWPGRESSDQEKHEDNQQNCAHSRRLFVSTVRWQSLSSVSISGSGRERLKRSTSNRDQNVLQWSRANLLFVRTPE